MNKTLKKFIETEFGFRLNTNQLLNVQRLVFEISRRESITTDTVLDNIKNTFDPLNCKGQDIYIALISALIKQRFPIASSQDEVQTNNIYFSKIKEKLTNNWQVKKEFKPLKIFVEKDVAQSYLAKNFKIHFPGVPFEIIDKYNHFLKSHKFSTMDLKKPYVFLVKENWDFIKPCPCTKNHLGCGYWIFNLGFGCPFDCSYCYLQQYTNTPGLILPANLEDFFVKFDAFYRNLKKPIRIGTGEFCDSLALDHITNYSTKLINYFKSKNVLFELKTKSVNINNILKLDPVKNVVISWSLNPQSIIDNQEKAAASLAQRLTAAKKIQDKGFSVGFHFDPIIFSNNWKELYLAVIEAIYKKLNPNLAWISLGALRCNRKLKNISESRFAESNIFYGELLLGEDNKLRYPKSIRKDIFQTMHRSIRKFDSKTPIYLCMEDKEIWSTIGSKQSTQEVENYLLNIGNDNPRI